MLYKLRLPKNDARYQESERTRIESGQWELSVGSSDSGCQEWTQMRPILALCAGLIFEKVWDKFKAPSDDPAIPWSSHLKIPDTGHNFLFILSESEASNPYPWSLILVYATVKMLQGCGLISV